jgi:hypothetical protein
MDEAIKIVIDLMELAVNGPDPVWLKIVLIIGTILLLLFFVGVICSITTYVSEEVKYYLKRRHGGKFDEIMGK